MRYHLHIPFSAASVMRTEIKDSLCCDASGCRLNFTAAAFEETPTMVSFKGTLFADEATWTASITYGLLMERGLQSWPPNDS